MAELGDRREAENRRIHRGQLGAGRAPSGLHVQEVVEETAVTGRVRLRSVRAFGEEPQRRPGARDGFLATMDVRPRDTDGVLYTADISAGNRPTRRATPFAARSEPAYMESW